MDFTQMFSKLGEMKEKVEQSRANLENIQVRAAMQGVTIIMTAGKNIVDIEISDELFNSGDKDAVIDALMAALKQANEKASDIAEKDMRDMGEGLLPGLSDLLR
ncbi:MAG: YbaB/EbfC family nucleoid-associated protein [Chitinophagales bacterium]|nr:YbaB/EbfC family nucleoid-associated protein [Bacteroidota bacterium]MCB9042629.1 YbaB/EbfC family nucleoid-associated protein [Chitinophagales bacterium]